MKTCKTCKHWVPAGGDFRANDLCEPVDPDTYIPMSRGFEVRICKMPTQTFAEAVVEPNGFGMTDASGYYAVLCTGEAFGCVRHEDAGQL